VMGYGHLLNEKFDFRVDINLFPLLIIIHCCIYTLQ
jgi:hypothetical protein